MVFEQNSNFSTVWAWENEATKKRGDGIRKSKVPFLTSFMIASGQVYLPKKDGKKLVDLLERLALGHSRWNYRCLSRLLEFNWSNEIGLKFRMFLDFESEQLLKKIPPNSVFCWFFACRWAEQVLPDVAELCKKIQNKSQTIIDACCFKALFKSRFYDFVPLLPSKLGAFQFLWVIKS